MSSESKLLESTDPVESNQEESDSEISREADECITYYQLDNWNERISRLFETKDFADVTFVFKRNRRHSHCIVAHRFLLEMISPTFYEMLHRSDTGERQCFDISEVEPDTFHLMLRHIYGKYVQIESISQCRKIAELSDKYKLLNLQKQCEDFANNYVNASNALLTFQESVLNQYSYLIERSLLFIVNETHAIVEEGGFTKQDCILPSTIKFILQLGDRVGLNIKSSLKLLEGLTAWSRTRLTINKASIEPANMYQELKSFLSHIGFLSEPYVEGKENSIETLCEGDIEEFLSYVTSPNSFPRPKWSIHETTTEMIYPLFRKYTSFFDMSVKASENFHSNSEKLLNIPLEDLSEIEHVRVCTDFKSKADLFITGLVISNCVHCNTMDSETNPDITVKVENEIRMSVVATEKIVRVDPPIFIRAGEMFQLIAALKDKSKVLYSCKEFFYDENEHIHPVYESDYELNSWGVNDVIVPPWCLFTEIKYFPIKI